MPEKSTERRMKTLQYNNYMGVIDDYISTFDGEKRAALKRVQKLIERAVPDAEQTIGYRMPTYALKQRPFIGFDARSKHLGIYPYSSTVLKALHNHLDGYGYSKGALRVPYNKPISESLIRRIIAERRKYL